MPGIHCNSDAGLLTRPELVSFRAHRRWQPFGPRRLQACNIRTCAAMRTSAAAKPSQDYQAPSIAKRVGLFASSLALASQVALVPAHAGVFPDLEYSPPDGWTGPVFTLSQDYPAQAPAAEDYPWQAIDFRTQPAQYLQAVLDYSFEGFINDASMDESFLPQKNTVRKWFHAPWLHAGANAREFVHGLTNERQSQKYELTKEQDVLATNSAVGYYNDQGGYTLGQVWADPAAPDPTQGNASFPEGAVSFKLLFTQAPVDKVPFLKGAPTWSADANRDASKPVVHTAAQVEATKVRLLQVDVAVKDNRADPAGGWVFGTFQYDSSVAAASPWRRVTPVALMWGDDPGLTPVMYKNGARPVASWVNPDAPVAAYRAAQPAGSTVPNVLGWAGRANGPVDNAVSSCLSCHGTSQIPASVGLIPGSEATDEQRMEWFRDLPVGQAFSAGSTSLDFSLQLGVGIQNQAASKAKQLTPLGAPPGQGLSLFASPRTKEQLPTIAEQLLAGNVTEPSE